MPLYYAVKVRITAIVLLLALAGCSSAPQDAKPTKPAAMPEPPGSAIPTSKHPLAKHLELVGFRVAEQGTGKLRVKFSAINHSEADLGDIGLKISLTTTKAKPDDPPIATFETKLTDLGPEETKDITVTVPTKLRLYELPDWQFLRAEFEITSPAR